MLNLFLKEIHGAFQSSRPFKEALSLLGRDEVRLRISGPTGGCLSLALGELALKRPSAPSLVVTPTEREAENIYQDLAAFGTGEKGRPAPVLFPWWGTAAYEWTNPLASLFGDRVQALSRLLSGEPLLVIAPLRAFLTPVPDPAHLVSQTYSVARGDRVDPQVTAERLARLGYLRVPVVSIHGEFAVRGEVVDVFIRGREEAVRLILDFDQVKDIRTFNPLDQSSTGNLPQIDITPCREVILTEENLQALSANLTAQGFGPKEIEELHSRIHEDPEMDGVELYYPLCFPRTFSLLDFMSADSTVFFIDAARMKQSADALRKEYLELFRRARARKLVVPGPQKILLDLESFTGRQKRWVDFPSLPEAPPAAEATAVGSSGVEQTTTSVSLPCDEPRSFFGNFTFLREEIEAALGSGYKIFIFAVYDVQADRLRHILKDLDVTILPDSISAGFTLPERKIMVIQEAEIFGRKRRIPRSVTTAKSSAIESFVELEPGDYVVHVNYGIGIFLGIERIQAAGNERDYIRLEYADGEKLFIPIEQVNLIQRYIGQEGRRPKLDLIGGKSWQKRKERAKHAVEDLAQGLLELYSRRKALPGYSFPADTDWQSEFEAAFPYQETEDQLRCIEEVKRDMEVPSVMDRLVCGDVGYGKTEIALRAAFKAVMGGKQVALLAPTTILVEQHLETFTERFKRFPVKIAMLSRFRSPKEIKAAMNGLVDGSIDIAIGTHRLIQKDIRFKNLGLLIIDEEQRFGVKHKERLKQLKTSVDCLTLTATPIPRTLNMSLMKIRDMSILNTPPQNRLPIETYVMEFSDELIARAVREEIARGGQVFYLHNRIETIEEIHLFLRRLVPEVSIVVGHGRLDEEELEEAMRRFIHNEAQVLLSTTIIENGLDIPNVNTIIIDRADMLGISQLYQLRGRVGRAGVPAYAYLFFPDRRALSEIAMKRLRIISDHTELGSGFKIALKDLEIRGAGNILGREQHGQILSVGFDMYLKLLDEAVSELSGKQREEAPEVYMELVYSGYIPDSYISDPMEKMEVYKKIAAITTEEEFDRVYREIEDRFGHMPQEVHSVLSLAEMRIICGKLAITSLKEEDGAIAVEFSRLSKVSVNRVVRMVKESGGRAYLDPERPTCLMLKTGSIGLAEKSEFVKERLSMLI
jgi:transcription-repair coupling factor (superfamily II helicase)